MDLNVRCVWREQERGWTLVFLLCM
jgi:hypothetical protein